jgi:putative membrane protein
VGVVIAAQRVVCDNCTDHMGRGWWWVMGIGWLVFLALVVTLVVVLVRHFGSPGGRGVRSAQDTLAERFARGEIDEEEYRRRARCPAGMIPHRRHARRLR